MTHVTCRLTAKNRDHLRNPTLGNRVWATLSFTCYCVAESVINFDAANASQYIPIRLVTTTTMTMIHGDRFFSKRRIATRTLCVTDKKRRNLPCDSRLRQSCCRERAAHSRWSRTDEWGNSGYRGGGSPPPVAASKAVQNSLKDNKKIKNQNRLFGTAAMRAGFTQLR